MYALVSMHAYTHVYLHVSTHACLPIVMANADMARMVMAYISMAYYGL